MSDETLDNRGPVTVVGRIALIVVVCGLFFAFARGGSDSSDGGDGADATGRGEVGANVDIADDGTTAAPETGASSDVVTPRFRPWPDPPEDHDPHVAGRPGPQEPVTDGSIGRTLVYVNGSGRPTVIDLATGDQRELDIAGPRDRDTFLVEYGRVVAEPGSDADLPKSGGRAFRFTVERTTVPGTVSSADRDAAISLTGPTICLDEGGCTGAPLLTGTFGDDLNRVTSMHAADSALQAIAEVVGSDRSRRDGRWTFFSLDTGVDAGAEWRVPTPMRSTVVWLIEQMPPDPQPG